jgi:serine/threonine protein kinase
LHSEHDRPVRPGDVLAGKYRVEHILGEGGMGIVVAATHLQLEQIVAIKLVLPSMLKSATVVERFLREARAAVRLKSAHVAKILDVGMLDSGAPYMSMEYLEGHDLGQVLEQEGSISIERAADYVVQACEAVAEAHSLGIVHRDLKPQNLFLARGIGGAPILKVLDFGISKVASEAASGLTQSQVTIGSPLFMAPEQMRSAKSVDGRADIWAMGVVLYKLLSGEVPFEAETMPELVFKVVNDPPRPLHDLRPDLPPALLATVERCLEKDPARRFDDIAELAAALEPFAPMSAHATIERARSVTATWRRSSTPALGSPPPLVPTRPSFVSSGGGGGGGATGSGGHPRAPSPSSPSASGGEGGERAQDAQGTLLIPTLSAWGNTRGDGKRRALSIAAVAAVALLAAVGVGAFAVLHTGGAHETTGAATEVREDTPADTVLPAAHPVAAAPTGPSVTSAVASPANVAAGAVPAAITPDAGTPVDAHVAAPPRPTAAAASTATSVTPPSVHTAPPPVDDMPTMR